MKSWGGLFSAAVFALVAIYALATGELTSALVFGKVAVIGAVAVIFNEFWQPWVTLRQYLLIPSFSCS